MSLQSEDPLLGRRFGSYVVEKLIGAGGMGAVYQAVQPEIGKRVAIKFLSPDLTHDLQVVQRFFAEARAVNLIQHENIVDIFDFRTADGYSYFVMELLPGSSLQAILSREGRLPVARTLAIVVQVAAAIAAAHARQIVHRDLKPDNIFLLLRGGFEDFVKVLDFGIAKLTPAPGQTLDDSLPRTLRGMVMGTPGYMSPEQGSGGTVDARTDVYALGVILHRMLAGKLPFEGASMEEILTAQLQRKAPSLTTVRGDVPAPLAELVREMLQREPSKRPQLMREVQERLVGVARLLSPTPSGRMVPVSDGWRSVPPTRLSGEQRQLAARKLSPALIATLAGVGVASAALIGWLVWRPSGARVETAPPPTLRAAPATANAPKAPTPIPPTASAPTAGSPTANAPPGTFPFYVETDPPGAEVWSATKLLGVTPVQLMLSDEQVLRLHKAGFRDEKVEATRGTEHQLLRLSRAAGRPHKPAPGQPSGDDGTGLGLND
jgi:serine/threonine-protein kinase